jgi:hypothetical protein
MSFICLLTFDSLHDVESSGSQLSHGTSWQMSPPFVEPEGLLSPSEMSTTGPYPELDESSRRAQPSFTLSSHLRLDLASGGSLLLVSLPELLLLFTHSPCVLYTPATFNWCPSSVVIKFSLVSSEFAAKRSGSSARRFCQASVVPTGEASDTSAWSGVYKMSQFSRRTKNTSLALHN